ncbi:hypothetical protein N7532_008026 [Penicillium argentinense]|uniref:Swi5-dependent recombination DNA repair protein 1 n=1 Tax=Penicillium argentinense TaxID=1131581 RepID=A0A9W9K241_9EURO|nr:uncharacterized protein N7532_008026 [Penicillium argentinense]KAJ5089342.1 hypothetical protein N7532_008026 [Penicillium argentinense]
MSSDRPPVKRRRLDLASALSKPFKSPFRKPLAVDQDLPQPTPRTPEAADPLNDEESAGPVPTRLVFRADSIAGASSPDASFVGHLRKSTPRRTGLSTPAQSPQGDTEIFNLQKQQRRLQSRLASLRTELDNASQAHRIESSTKDAELEALILKWRLVSQDAADEVFTGAQERVKAMGGLAAWRARSRLDTSRWDFENENHNREDENEEGDQPGYSGGKDNVIEENEGEEEEFTMECMLKMLNISPKMIGLDTSTGKWIR